MKISMIALGSIACGLVSALTASASPAPNCTHGETGPFDFARLKETIEHCQLQSIDSLIPLLPEEYRERYTLVHTSRSLQSASPEYPRVISFGNTAKLILAFTGDPRARGYEMLETAEFDTATRRFNFRAVRFSGGAPTFTGTNPSSCTVCHKQDARPNWEGYLLWPGVYGAEDDNMFYKGEADAAKFPAEKALYAKYLPQRTTGRYQHLADFKGLARAPSPRPLDAEGHIDYFALGRHNLGFTVAVGGLNAQRIVRKLVENPETHRFRYAILAALTCHRTKFTDESVSFLDTYIPDRLRATFAVPHKDFFKAGWPRARANVVERIERHLAIMGLTRPEDARVITSYDDPTMTFDGGPERNLPSSFRYLMQGIPGLNIDDWSMEFFPDGRSYDSFHMARSVMGAVEEYYWKDVLDPVADADLFGPMAAAAARGIATYSLTYADDAEHLQVCSILKQKSLDALK